ncbi:hypothetical protein EYR41_008131 [Orbilia oligospora]|uniref:Uncharacterized protein n=1 Tax=Orbilia oligospora TaxID=2813651 RepID=A0A7C8K9P5_ORBOL|nr:hypothetical protein TWF751_011391 [Orbilia oligospora]TGJ66504.1 hypothetical protein EYR41_008131 [Orbilia oligospora]
MNEWGGPKKPATVVVGRQVKKKKKRAPLVVNWGKRKDPREKFVDSKKLFLKAFEFHLTGRRGYPLLFVARRTRTTRTTDSNAEKKHPVSVHKLARCRRKIKYKNKK